MTVQLGPGEAELIDADEAMPWQPEMLLQSALVHEAEALRVVTGPFVVYVGVGIDLVEGRS